MRTLLLVVLLGWFAALQEPIGSRDRLPRFTPQPLSPARGAGR